MENQKQFDTSAKNLKSHKLFAETNLFKAILKVASTGLLIALMMGIYVFADQLLLSRLVPHDGVHNFDEIFQYDEATIRSAVDYFNNNNPDYNIDFLTVSEIIKSSISISTPLVLILNAVPLLGAMGASILFTQSIARNDLYKGKQIYKTSFYAMIAIALMSVVVFASINKMVLEITSGSDMNFDSLTPNSTEQIAINYYKDCRNFQTLWASRYTLMLAFGTFFNCILTYYSFMIRAEGRIFLVTIGAIFCNLLNIGLDVLMISVFKLGMAGGGIASIIGWATNAGIYIAYVYCLSRKEKTWLKFKHLKPDKQIKFSWSIFLPILILGLSVFLRNMSNAVANALFSMQLNNVSNIINPGSGQTFQMLSGAVLPVNNLFFYAMFGVVDGIRPMCAYCYGKSMYKRTRQSYYAIILIALAYGLLVFGLMSSPVGGYMLSWFDIDAMYLADAARYLNIQCLVIMFTSFSLGGLMIFQASNRLTCAVVVSILQGLLTFPLVLFVMSTLALQFGDPWIYVATNATNAGFASIIIFVWTNIFMFTFMSKRLIKHKVYVAKENQYKTIRYFVACNSPKESYAQKQLERH